MWKKIGHAREFVKTLGENLSKAKRIEGLGVPPASISKEEKLTHKRKDELRIMARAVLDIGRSKLGNFRKGILSITRNPKVESDNTSLSNNHQLHSTDSIMKEGFLFGPGIREKKSWVAIETCCLLVYDQYPENDESQSPACLVNLQHVDLLECTDSTGIYLRCRESDTEIGAGWSTLKFWSEDEASAASWILALRANIPNPNAHGYDLAEATGVTS